MLPGLDGHLVSSAFLEGDIASLGHAAEVERAQRQLAAAREACAGLGPAAATRAILDVAAAPLAALLGFSSPADVERADAGLVASLRGGHRPIALVVVPWGTPYDPMWRAAVTHAGRRDAAWCFLFDGLRLRIVDGIRLYARRHLEFDLELAADQPGTFAAFWRTCHASRAGADAGDPRSLHALVAASDRHAAGVCRSLRDGVLTAATEILRAMAAQRRRAPDRRALDAALEQALTIVYRILFLLFAEARALVPVWHPVYRDGYSVEAMRDEAERSTRTTGLWDALRAMARLAHNGCRAGDLRVTAFNGRLFAPSRTPLADRRDLDDGAAQRAVVALSTRTAADGAGRERIAYRDLGVEQLGAVYETLLDYQPVHDDRGGVTLRCGSGVRKATGTFYTPQPIAEYLVRRTLAPIVSDLPAAGILQLRIVDPAMGSGAFLVAACRYLAAAYEAAMIRDGECHAADIDEPQRANIRRAIAERCLYGVDLNPMAVQLARLSLWLATLAADRPLSFLDHRLQTGDSLLGTWIEHLRRPATPRRTARSGEPLPLFKDEAVATALRDALPIRFSLESTPNDTVDQVRVKERALAALTARDSTLTRWKLVAHLWCSPWFAGAGDPPASAFGALSDAALTGRSALPARTAQRFLAAAAELAESRRLFHWELEFPEAFFDADGSRHPRPGFDAVIGNPPWDMIRADAGESDARSRARSALSPLLRFTRDAGVYTAQSEGHANRYQLFVERAIALTRPGGRVGLVLPSGFATDCGSARLRRFLLSRCDVDALVGMDNHRGVFPIHRSVGFLLVTATAGSATERIACRFGIDDPATLESLEDAGDLQAFPVHLTSALLDRLSGPALSIPHLRTTVDVAIAERAATLFRPLGADDGWGARFGRELNATDDRDAFRADRDGLLVVDGKHLDSFRATLDGVERSISIDDARRRLRSDRHDRPRLAYRDVAGATNRVTLIAAVLPRGVVSTHTVFCLRTPLALPAQYFLCGLFNSLVVNYLARLRITTHVTTAVVERLPIPAVEDAPSAFDEIAALARALERRHDDRAFARLNARVAQLYQLGADEFRHVLDTFPLVPLDERRLALKVFSEDRRHSL